LNAKIARRKSLFANDEEKRKAMLMTRPIDSRQAFGLFGLMIGSLPLFAVALNILFPGGGDASGVASIFAVVGVITGLTGFGLGRRFVPRAVRYASNCSAPNRVALWIVIGLAWGAVSGAAGGLVIFIFGAFFGAIIGGVIGAVAVPIMVALHSSVRVGDFVETKHFLPIAFGISLSLCAFVLSF